MDVSLHIKDYMNLKEFQITLYMNRKLFAIVLCLMCILDVLAQDIEVKKFELMSKDQTEGMSMRNDNNGNPCALLIVHSLKKGMEFEGWVVGDVDYEDDAYWVNVADGAKHIKIKHADYQTKDVISGDYNISSLKSGEAYNLYLIDDNKDIINKIYSKGWNIEDFEIPQNVKQILRSAASRGDKKAQVAMAQLTLIKNGDSNQNEPAYHWIEQLLLKGDSSCLDVMPGELMYIHAKRQKSKIWRGSSRVDRDTEKSIYTNACQYEIKSCLKGYKEAGDDLFIDFPQSNGISEGCDYLKRICIDSANVGNIHAMRCLGLMYEEGLCVKQDLLIATSWYEKVNKVKSTSQSKTDLCRVYGSNNYPIDNMGLEFIKESAIENIPEALFQLGLMYEEGRNFPKDLNKAIEYYLKISPDNSYRDKHPKASCRLAEYYFNRKEYKKASSFLVGLNDDDALYWGAIIDFYQSDYTNNRVSVFNTLNYLSKKGYQKATDFIKNNY